MKPAGLIAAALIAAAPLANAEFKLTLEWGNNISEAQKVYFTQAAEAWQSHITGYKEGVTLTGITINADIAADDGPGGRLGYARSTEFTTQLGTYYVTAGEMRFDSADVAEMIADGSFGKVVEHEMCHILGISRTVWAPNNLAVDGSGKYTGANALAAWRDEFGQTNDTFVPLEQGGGGGTANSHWNEVDGGAGDTGIVSKYTGKDFKLELMTGWANGSEMFTSTVTLGSLMDLGYTIGIPTDENGNYIIKQGTYFGQMTGPHFMRKITDGTATLLGDNTFTNGAFVEGGTIIVGNNGALGRGTLLVQNGATIDARTFDLAGITTLTLENGTLTGSSGSITAGNYILQAGTVSVKLQGGAVTKSGDGTLYILSANTYTGGTVITGGTLVTGNAYALSSGEVSVTGGTLDVEWGLVLGGALTVNGGTVTSGITFSGNPATIKATAFNLLSGTVSASLEGSAAVTKSGNGTVTLSGDNSYTGGTFVDSGTLRVAGAHALSTGTVTVSGGTLDVGDTAVTGVGSLVLYDGLITGATGSISAGAFELHKGVVSAGLAGTAAVTKKDADTVTLSGSNTFTGGLIVQDGQIIADGANALGAGNVSTSGSGNVLIKHSEAAALATVNLAGGSIHFDASLTKASIGTLVGNTGLTLVNTGGQAFALTLGTNNSTGTYSGAFSGTGSLTKAGTGNLTLSAASTHTGGTNVTGGVLTLANASALGAGSIGVLGGRLDVGSYNVVAPGALTLDSGSITSTSVGSITASGFDVKSGTVAATLAGSGALTKTGSGQVLVTSANTYTGGTTVAEGTLKVTNYRGLSTGPLVVDGGTLTAEASISGLSSLRLSSGGTMNGFIGSVNAGAYDLQDGTISIKIAGAATVEKNTAGTVLLTAANSLTGAVNINEGTLAIAHAYALGKGLTTVRSGATLQVGNDNGFTADWVGQEVKLDGGTLDFRLTSNTTVTRTLSGTGGVELNGTGTITLQNAIYSGDTVVNSGKLILEPAAIPQGRVAVNGAGTVEIKTDGSTYDVTKDISGNGTVRFSGNGTVVMHDALSHTGEITVASGTRLSLGATTGDSVALNNGLVRIEQGGRLAGSGSIAGSLVNAGTIAPGFSPGTITLAGDLVSTGTLQMEIATDGTHDQIRYAGQALIGGTLQIVNLGTPRPGTTVSLLVDTDTTDGRPSVVGEFARVITPASGGVAYATGTGINYIVGGTIFNLPGADTPQAGRLGGFANALTAAGASNTQIAGITSTFANSGATLARNVTSAAPLGLASATALPLSQALGDTDQLYRHLNARRFDRSQNWLLDYSPYAYVNSASATADDGEDGQTFDHDSVGASVGADYEPAEDITLGAKVGYDSGKANFHHGYGKLTQDHLRVTVYGSQLIEQRYFVDAGAFGGYSLYDSTRHTALGKATGDTTGWDVGAFVTAGFVKPLTKSTSLTPHIGLTVTRAQVDAFDESGNALALKIDGYSQTSIASRIGSGLNHSAKIGNLKMRVSLDASWVHEFLDNEVDIDGTVAGTGFTTSAVSTVKDHLEVGPEIDVVTSETSSVSLSYKFDYAFGDATSHRFDIGYRTRF